MKVWKTGVLVAFALALPLAVAAESQRTHGNNAWESMGRQMKGISFESMVRSYDHDVDDEETDDDDQSISPRMPFTGSGINGLANGLGHVNMTSEKMGKMIARKLGFKNATVETRNVDNETFYVVSGMDIRKTGNRFLNKTFEAWFDASTGKIVSFDANIHALLTKEQ